MIAEVAFQKRNFHRFIFSVAESEKTRKRKNVSCGIFLVWQNPKKNQKEERKRKTKTLQWELYLDLAIWLKQNTKEKFDAETFSLSQNKQFHFAFLVI